MLKKVSLRAFSWGRSELLLSHFLHRFDQILVLGLAGLGRVAS
jgi:hypothetical protein